MSQSWRPSQGPRHSQDSGPQPPYGPPDPGYGHPGPNSGGGFQPDYGYGEYGGPGYGEQGDSGYGPPDPGYGRSDPGYGQPGYGYRSVPSRPGPQSGWSPAQDDSGWGGAGAQPPSRYADYPQYPEYSQYPQAPYQQYQQAPYGQYPGHPYDDPYAYSRPPRRPQQSRSRGWVLPLVIMLLVFLAVGVGAAYALTRTLATKPTTAQSTATTTSKTPGAIPVGFKAYSEPAAHVRFAIPNGWTTQGTATGATGLIVLSPDESSAFIVKQYSGTLDKVSAATGGLAGAAGAAGTVSNKQGPTTVSLAGASWVQESADITRDGQTLHMVILVTNRGGASYAFGYFAYKSSFASANTRYFQPAQASFTFI